MSRTILAISLGVRNSLACLQKNGQTLQVCDELDGGSFSFPSLVTYHDGKAIPCNRAKNGRVDGSFKYVVENVSLLIGLTFEEYLRLPDRNIFGCEVVEGSDGYPRFIVSDGGMKRDCIEVTLELFKAIKRNAIRLNDNKKIDECCLSIPPGCSDNQVHALVTAAKRAKLRLRILVLEPIAAVMSWYTNGVDRYEKMLVFDFGSKALDISIVEHKKDGQFWVVSSAQECVGESDVDMEIAKMVIDMVHSREDDSFNPLQNRRQRSRFLAKCKEVRICLLSALAADIDLSEFDLEEEYVFNQSQLNTVFSTTLMGRVDCCLHRSIRSGGCNCGDIKRVILVGSFTRLPYIQDYIHRQFHCDIPIVLPDTCVVEGTLKVAIEHNSEFDSTALSYSYGVLCGKDRVVMILNKGKEIPCDSEQLPFRVAKTGISLSIYSWDGKDSDVGALVKSKDQCEYVGDVMFQNPDEDEIVDIEMKVVKGEMIAEAYRHRTSVLLPSIHSHVNYNYRLVLCVCCVPWFSFPLFSNYLFYISWCSASIALQRPFVLAV